MLKTHVPGDHKKRELMDLASRSFPGCKYYNFWKIKKISGRGHLELHWSKKPKHFGEPNKNGSGFENIVQVTEFPFFCGHPVILKIKILLILFKSKKPRDCSYVVAYFARV